MQYSRGKNRGLILIVFCYRNNVCEMAKKRRSYQHNIWYEKCIVTISNIGKGWIYSNTCNALTSFFKLYTTACAICYLSLACRSLCVFNLSCKIVLRWNSSLRILHLKYLSLIITAIYISKKKNTDLCKNIYIIIWKCNNVAC